MICHNNDAYFYTKKNYIHFFYTIVAIYATDNHHHRKYFLDTQFKLDERRNELYSGFRSAVVLSMWVVVSSSSLLLPLPLSKREWMFSNCCVYVDNSYKALVLRECFDKIFFFSFFSFCIQKFSRYRSFGMCRALWIFLVRQIQTDVRSM